MSLVAEPNINSPANVDAAKLWRDNRPEFIKVSNCTKCSVKIKTSLAFLSWSYFWEFSYLSMLALSIINRKIGPL